MSGIGNGYDLSSSTFSPDGRIFQVEYAHKAVENSGTAVGVACKDGVVLAVEKLVVSKMLVPGTLRRVHIIDRHCGMAICGLLADGRQLVTQTRNECANYRSFYAEKMPGHFVADRLSNFMHVYTLYGGYVRAFGCAVLLGSYGDDGPQLYMVEPSGVCYRYFGCAVGKAKQAAKTELEKINFKEVTCREAVKALAKIIVGVHDETKDKDYELEMLWVCDESKRQCQMVPKDLVEEAHNLAKAADEEDDMDDD
mmetsp:Transcript_24591/g.59827  ORF Transcript_24591/g.59827 Transcript_24591/m.59827 type:complete len:253 (-) Transcript_24591:58-816(-)|eukprot:CAMPEP_0198314564 /NCGR_PEP_ID=MMETSP1450-20131203/5155_1 /TAXON_ID=753684 ORGANISM="Madagascaria erythrocladiodes, Strain CCMP3234" /NCGR_SAMPLE_ID=MMETSP1450 /ASSEMBLY_ACC=CAM_ASM_001115 /LENGTH=252 /DNA_ID=CAMNT_0044017619 /DNA_START=99 /DNA_END=857 /DNA_ORIENTATION=-